MTFRRLSSLIALLMLASFMTAAPAAASTVSISGIVSDGTGPLESVELHVWDASTLEEVTSSFAGAGGLYSIDVSPGSYLVSAFDPDSRGVTYHPAASSWVDAIAVTVEASNVENVDITANALGSLAGTLTDASTGRVLSGFCVELATDHGSIEVESDGDGAFMIPDLDGMYELTVSDCALGTHRVTSLPSIAVPPGTSRAIDVAVEPVPAGRITGTATDGEAALGSVFVFAHAVGSGSVTAVGITGGSGAYQILDLDPGSYELLFVDFDGSGTARAAVWYPGASQRADAVAVAVADGAVTVDQVLPQGGSITGTVADVNGSIASAYVEVLDDSGTLIKGAFTNGSGSYSVSGLAGVYAVRVSAAGHDSTVDESVTVVGGGSATLDVTLTLIPPTSVEGVVTGSGGPLNGICVTLMSPDPVSTDTDASGAYSLREAPPGTHAVTFEDCAGIRAHAMQSATVTVESGAALSGVDARLEILERPSGLPDQYDVEIGDELTGDVSTNDEGLDLSVQLIAGPSSGTLALSGDGTFSYEADPGESRVDGFTYVAIASKSVVSEVVAVTIDVTKPYISSDLVAAVEADVTGDGLSDVVHVDADYGFYVAVSGGSSFDVVWWAEPVVGASWVEFVSGDFDGNGITDVAGFDETTGTWWVLLSDGSSFTMSSWAQFGTKSGWTKRLVGDFNGDGRDDIANYHPNLKRWWVSISTGTRFGTQLWAEFGTGAGWNGQLVGDFNGDGKDDIANFHPTLGRWWISVSTGTGFGTAKWADFYFDPENRWPNPVWVNHVAGDFNNDGFDDVGVFDETSGQWVISISNGSGFVSLDPVDPEDPGNGDPWATFGTKTGWTIAVAGDFNNDGNVDVANYHPTLKRWWISISTGTRFGTFMWAEFGTGGGWGPHLLGDYNGDDVPDIANFHPALGRWWVSISLTNRFSTTKWAEIGPTTPF